MRKERESWKIKQLQQKQRCYVKSGTKRITFFFGVSFKKQTMKCQKCQKECEGERERGRKKFEESREKMSEAAEISD